MTLFAAREARAGLEARRIWLQASVFDPLTDPPVPPDLAGFPTAVVAAPSDYCFLQSTGSANGAWRASIAARGGVSLDFLRSGTSIVRAPHGSRSAFDTVPTRRATTDILPAHRLSASAIEGWKHPENAPCFPDGTRRVVVTFMNGEEPSAYIGDILARIGPGASLRSSRSPDASRALDGMATITCSEAALPKTIEESARTAAVKAVEIESVPHGSDTNAQWYHQTGIPDTTPPRDYALSGWLFQNGITGEGEIVTISDVEQIPEFTGHCALRWSYEPGSQPPADEFTFTEPVLTTGHPLGRIIAHYRAPGIAGAERHGLVMALVAAGDLVDDCLAIDDDPWRPGDCGIASGVEHEADREGMAPGVRLIFQECDAQVTPELVHYLHEQAYGTRPNPYQEGCRIFQSAVNGDRFIGEPPHLYAQVEAELDRFLQLQRDFSIVVSAGNAGLERYSLELPGATMSGIAVGATEYPGEPAHGLGQDIWFNPVSTPQQGSARGPSARYRVKPDIVAATDVHAYDRAGCGTGMIAGGTSSASAVASGLAAMVRQYLREGYYPGGSACAAHLNPTNALVKALLINSTRNLSGVYTTDDLLAVHADRPSFGQGWGAPVLDDTLFFAGDPISTSPAERKYLLVLTDTPNGAVPGAAYVDDRSETLVDMRPGIREEEIHEFTVRGKPGEDLHVTLAWAPMPGASQSSYPLTADLDLEVVGPDPDNAAQSVVWRPNAGVSSDVLPDGTLRDKARTWQGGYTELGPALCGDPPPANVIDEGTDPDLPDYADCPSRPTCPATEPQYLHEQSLPFRCYDHRDPFNTVENVFLRASDVRDADYRIRVIGFEIPAQVVDPANPPIAQPNYDTSDGDPDFDHPDFERQGYALVVSGDVSADRGFVHLDRAHYVPCDDVQVTVVDRNMAANAAVEVRSASGDVETVVSDASGRFPALPSRAPDPSVTLGDGVLQFVAGDAVTARYDDAAPVHPSTACASTGPLFTVTSGLREMCGDGDGLVDPGETAWLDVTITNVSIRTLEGAVGVLEVSSIIDPIMDRALFNPGIIKPLDSATATFGVAIPPTAACPVNDTVALTIFVDGRVCYTSNGPAPISWTG